MMLCNSFIISVIVITLVPLIINIWYALYRLGSCDLNVYIINGRK